MTQISEYIQELKDAFAELPKGPFFSQKIDAETWKVVSINDKEKVIEVCRNSRKFWPSMEVILNSVPWLFRVIENIPKMEQEATDLRVRIKILEDGIREHQGRTTTFRPGEINPIDIELWTMVPPSPNDHIRGTSNAKTTRVSPADLTADDLSATSWCSGFQGSDGESRKGDQADGNASNQINDGCMQHSDLSDSTST